MILVVDDDPSVTASLALLLKQAGRAARVAASPEEALAALAVEPVELILQDMNFSRETSGNEGMDLLREIRSRRPDLPVILITAWGSIDLAVEGMKAGAADFVTKPWSNARILSAIDTTLSLRADSTRGDAGALSRSQLDATHDFADLVGEAPGFLEVLAVVGRVSATDASVLITGESGTGKELVAAAIHNNSGRSAAPFVKVNLGGISSTLFESEMFGHVRGAFTDALADRAGRFAAADGGTIFLDEIGELEPSAQVKLLRVLQDRTYEMLGSSMPRTVDVRIISATNRDLAERVRVGAFREDLLYRLNLISLRLPPLRERRGDIPLLARHFLTEFGRSYRRQSLALTERAERWLTEQPLPGNVRQLRQWLERAVLLNDGSKVDVADLRTLGDLADRTGDELPAAGSMTLDELERRMISKCLEHYRGNVSRVAEALGLTRQALYRRLSKYGLDSVGSEP